MARTGDDTAPGDGLPFVFEGIDSPNGTIFPDILLDRVMAHLSGAEFKVLAYIVRRTFGFKKDADAISLDQICHGIARRDGSILDEGTGLTRKTAIAALKGLEEKEVVIVRRRSSPTRGNLPSTFALRFRTPTLAPPDGAEDDEFDSDSGAHDGPVSRGVEKSTPRGGNTPLPRVEARHSGGSDSTHGRGTNRYPQQTGTQQTDKTMVVAGDLPIKADRPEATRAGSWTAEQAEALASLVAEGVSTHRALDLCQRFAPESIRRQIAWIDSRRYDDRAGCLVAAIEQGYSAPTPSPRRRPGAQSGSRREPLADVSRYSQGPYGVCPSCGCSPCDPACPESRRPPAGRRLAEQ